ncbi:MAG TPA: molybdenum cofactor guanylyltransferase [Gemmataceae bacterium]|jgi:molybdopterin-guanine dinucleotide biosynthesis protein A|nr:molybdenum cofactor guanylyltransferase [Gemmataceae bacterium]
MAQQAGGIVLCGGKSSRMGRPKAWLPFGDEVLLQRVVRVLSDVVHPIVVVAAPDQEVPPLPADVALVRDDNEFLGPLNGLAAGLAALTGKVEVAYMSSCDVPFLRSAFVRRVIECIGENSIGIPETDGFRHPLAAAYRVDILPLVLELLAAGQRRPAALTDRSPTRTLSRADFHEVDPDLESLRNVNTPEDYVAALNTAVPRPAP